MTSASSASDLAARRKLLRSLAERFGLDPASLDLDALSRRARSEAGPRVDGLAAALRQAGLRAVAFRATTDEALARCTEDRVLVVPQPRAGAPGERWAVIAARGRRRVTLERIGPEGVTEERSARTSLARSLGKESTDLHDWTMVESAAPCDGASGPGGAQLGPLRRLVRLLQPDIGEVWTVVVFAIATGVLMLATPIAVQALVNFVAFGGAIPPLVVVALLLLLGLGFAAALTATQTWIVEILQRRIFVRMVADLAARLPRVTLAARGHGYGPELVNRFFDIVTIQKVGSALLLDGLSVLLSVMVGLSILAFYHPLLLAFDILLLLVIGGLVLGPARRGVSTAIKESKAKYAVAAWLEEIARNPLAFKSSGAQQWVFDESDRLARGYVESRRVHYRVVFGQVVGALTLQVLASTALLTIGGLLVIRGSLTLGQLVAAELIVTMVVASVAKMGKHLEGFYDLMAAVDKVGQLLDLPTESMAGELPVPTREGATLELREVSSRASAGLGPFDGLSADVEAGARVGLTGGPARTRLLELLWGLDRPDAGSIRIDGRDVRDLAAEYLRRDVQLVVGAEAIAGTVRENVRLGRSYVSDDDMRAALRKVGMLETVLALPGGLDAKIASDGYPFTDAELETLAVARAIAGEPRLLLLDGSLDRMAGPDRRRLLDLLFDPEASWTLIVASDLPEVLARCDQVLKLPAGRAGDSAGKELVGA